ncbi:MAG: DNA/RNA nuclease SfsA [Desulfobacteraceae bacterium]|nr:DNA/RNA nuclease SfsA [Desulfobacteraceae bacterium]
MEQFCFIKLPELTQGTLISRYKRFLADVRLETGDIVTAHCPNSGSMTGCSRPGQPVYLSVSDNPKRKLKYTWEIIEMPESRVGVNTLMPNRLVRQCAENNVIPELSGYDRIKPEVRTGDHTRFDLMLTRDDAARCYVEIKNCTLVENGTGYFPDAKTQRGKNHLEELQRQVKLGHRCIMFYLIQRMDAQSFMPAHGIDPAYGAELRRAAENGVEILVYDVDLDLTRIRLGRALPWRL